jgi:hypothetical protein
MNQRIPIIALVVLLALIAGVFYWANQQQILPSRFNWNESSVSGDSYDPESDQPYGSLILWRLLNRYFPDYKVIELTGKNLEQGLPLDQSKHSSYFFLGAGFYLDSIAQDHLLRYVANGNTALISTRVMPSTLFQELLGEEPCTMDTSWLGNEFGSVSDTTARLHLLWPQAMPTAVLYANRNRTEAYVWEHVRRDFFCAENEVAALGYLNDSLVNFARFPYGEGEFLIHTTPIVFSNYHLLRTTAQQYAAGVLAQLPEGDIYWDNANQVSQERVRRSNNSEDRPHPLAFILRYESLSWAWYLMLGLATTYVIFRSRRRQRAIPVLPKNENTSREFISQIARLHFKSRNFQWASIQIMRQFCQQIRERYGLQWALDPKTNLVNADVSLQQRLAEKSGVSLAEIQQLIVLYEEMARFISTDEELLGLYRQVADFWAKAK